MSKTIQEHFGKHTDAQRSVDWAERIRQNAFQYKLSNDALSIDAMISKIADDAREHRVDRLAKYIGDASPSHNRVVFEQAITRLAYDDEGKKIPAQEFSKNLYAIYGAVFTGHPVTSKTLEEGKALSNAACARASKEDQETIESADDALHKASQEPFEKPTLASESASSIEAIRSTRLARAKMTQIAMKVGQELYGDEWTDIDYMPTTVATWIPFDWDGRTDVEPKDIMHRRIELQTLMLGEYEERFSELRDMIQDSADRSTIEGLIERIESTRVNMQEYQSFFENYEASQDPDGRILAREYAQFKNDSNWRLTDPKDLIGPLNEVLKNTDSDQTGVLESLVHLRSDLKNDGLSYAQIHFRLNAKSLNSAIGEHGLQIDADTSPKQTDDANFDKLSQMVDEVQPQNSDLISTMKSRQTVAKQMGMIAEFDKYIEQGRNVRFLIAETDKAITPLTALYFAKTYGIDKKISISGLCEDRDGQTEFKRLSQLLLTNQSYRDHVFTPKENHPFQMSVEADQFGFSDSHRYDGAIAAGAHMGRAMGQKEKVLAEARVDIEDVPTVHLTNFSTGGQSLNRGFHPLGPDHEAQYKLAPHVLKNARGSDTKVTLETSFQGMDGNIYMLNPDMAFAYMAQSINYLTDRELHQELANDPFYDKDGLRRDAYDFFETVRDTHAGLINKRGYAEIIDQFVRSVLSTGSRPVKRPKDSGGERDLPRAIQHGGTLSRLSMWSTVMDGVGAAINENEDRFDRLRTSDVFNDQFLTTVQHALKETMSGVIRAEVELYNPKFWEERAKSTQGEQRSDHNSSVANHMKRLNIYPDMMRVVEQMEQNAKNLQQIFEEKGLTLEEEGASAHQSKTAKYNKAVLHATRISSMIGIFTKAMDIPEMDEDRHEISRKEVIDRLFMFDDTILDDLRERIFPNHSEIGYRRLHGEVLDPIGDEFELLKEDAAGPLIDYNNGVG